MAEHIASVAPGSFEHLGSDGIAFAVVCSCDPGKPERHTIMHTHTMSPTELRLIIQRQYLKKTEEKHFATEMNLQHIEILTMGQPATGDCGCSEKKD
jgi:hypothetical protein